MQSTRRAQARERSLDGLRGLALILVLLSHGWALWPTDEVKEGTPWGQALRSGNLGVTIFLVVGGYLLIDGLMRMPVEHAAGEFCRALVRRVIRIAVPVLVLLTAILAASVLDETDKTPPEATRRSVVAVATFTWNWYLQNNPLVARSDLGHLWYVSVFVQATLLLTGLFFVFRRHLWAFVVVASLMLVLVIWWRAHLAGQESDTIAMLLRTSARIDGMLWGALLAAARPWWGKLAIPPPVMALAGLLSLLVLTLTVGNSTLYYGWRGQAMALGTAAAVVGLAGLDRQWRGTRMLSVAPLAWLGQNSLTIYVWHFPLFFLVARHSTEWAWPLRTAVGLVLTCATCYILIRAVERPVAAWLRSWRWTRPRSTTSQPILESVDAR
ncbi:hypothetical protein AWH69_12475 [Janibacter melonis]|uniref:Acyltransferase 3 domain-containing protein n=1 Tax=Janibacter melonis TaxID=262209 RepID=A0A176QBQ5_9MICO|nr:acyltransferase [Janibacter melonis]OAB87163.1 hypothetical protein AWH69_12475 [Janibacter melonis]